MYWLGFLVSLIIVLCSSLTIILIYFIIDRFAKNKGVKNLNLYFIFTLFVITLGIHLFCITNTCDFQSAIHSGDGQFFNAIGYGLREIYRTLGGITFEGQEYELQNLYLGCLYFGSTACLGVSNVLLIGIGISYEFRCKLKFWPRKRLTSFNILKCPIFIFTSVSREMLDLADSLTLDKNYSYKTKYEIINEREISNKRKRPLIIFAGDEIGPFDKNNELHQRIRMSNYYYFNFGKRKKYKLKNDKKKYYKNDLIYRIFGFRVLPSSFLFNFLQNKDCYIFAMFKDEDGRGNESKNSDIIFDDFRSLAYRVLPAFQKKYKKDQNKDPKPGKIQYSYTEKFAPHLDYFFLSNRENNYEFVEKTLNEILDELNFDHLKNVSDDNEEKEKEKEKKLINKEKNIFKCIFGINPVNEAILSGENLVKVRQSLLINELKKETTNGWEINHTENNVFKVLSLGFDSNGQEALCHIYTDCLGGKLDEDTDYLFEPNKFHANVIDEDITKKIYTFEVNHPFFICNPGYFNWFNYEDNYKDLINNKIIDFYELNENDKDSIMDLDRHMAFPRIKYESMNVFEHKFSKVVSDIITRNYDAVLICLGNDELNLKCANEIFKSIRQSVNCIKVNSNRKTHIYVNIRDEDNNRRLCWDNVEDAKLFENFEVHVFGNTKAIYSTDLFDFDGPLQLDKTYNEIKTENKYSENKNGNTKVLNDYYKLPMYKKKSNENCCGFGKYCYVYLKKNNLSETLMDENNSDFDNYKSLINNSFFRINDYSIQILEKSDGSNSVKKYIRAVDSEGNIKKCKEILYGSDKEHNFYPSLCFANYFRIKCTVDADYFDKIGRNWYYFAQLEHMRWCRFMIMYGRVYTRNYNGKYTTFKVGKDDEDEWKDRWKDIYQINNCIIPYTITPYFSSTSSKAYLPYDAEDYDYDMILKTYSYCVNFFKSALNNNNTSNINNEEIKI